MTLSRQNLLRYMARVRRAGRWLLPGLFGGNMTDDRVRRRLFVGALCLLGIPLALMDALVEYRAGPNFMVPMLLTGVALLLVVLVSIRKGIAEGFFTRLALAYATLVSIAPVFLDRGPEQLFYLLIFPVVAIFIFGILEGVLWSLGSLVATLLIVDAADIFEVQNIAMGSADFVSAYLILMVFAGCYEALRQKSQQVADERDQRFREERASLLNMQDVMSAREQRFRRYASMSTDWLFELDEQLSISYMSLKFQQTTGILREDVVDRSVFQFIERFEECDREAHSQLLMQHKPFRDFRYQMRKPDGGVIYVLSRGEPLTDEQGRFTGYICTGTDITDHEVFQQEIRARDRTLHHVQKMDAIGQLTSGVAHDFNNLLTVIKGNLEFLRFSSNENTDMESVESIASAVEQASDLTGKLLAVSKRQSMEADAIDLQETFAELETLIRHSVGERVSLEMIIAPEVSACYADRSQMGSAIINLALNARDAMEGKGNLVVTARDVEVTGDDELEDGDYVRISVIDNGKGMPANIVDKVIEPFFTTKAVGEGTGLGLSMVYGFVTQSRGKLTIESSEHIGTNVSLLLPRASGSTKSTVETDTGHHAVTQTHTALMVEDEQSVQNIVGRMLRLMGYDTVVCDSAENALEVVSDIRPDLLLTDMMLGPGMNGLELAAQVTRNHPDVRIMLMSGYPEEILENASESELEFKLLRKPFGFKDLSQSLEELYQ